MERVEIVDTTLRDGQQSMWAGRMRTEALLPAIRDMDAAGLHAMEFTSPTVQFPRVVRDLKENPWDWVRMGAAEVAHTPLRLHGGIQTRLARIPMCVRDLLLDRLSEVGVRHTRTSDPWNNFATMSRALQVMRGHGIETVLNIIYSVSERHTLDYYARKTREAVAIGPYHICFKDVGGLLTPEAAREVLPVVLANAGDTLVEFHAHSSSGLAPYVALAAAEVGVRIIHAAIPPLADGWSQPSVLTLVRNLRRRGFDVPVDLAPLERVSAHFHRVAEIEGLPVGRPREYDERLYRHQVPGGMISHLQFQLAQLGKGNLIDTALDEVHRVRVDLGYPIMVSPLAQFVGTQAVINVMTGERFGTVTDETIAYALGHFGAEAVEVMDPAIRERILDRPRAQEIAQWGRDDAAEPSLDEVRKRYGGDISDDDLIVRAVLGTSGTTIDIPPSRRHPRTYEEYRAAHQPLTDVVAAFAANHRFDRLEWRSPDGHLIVEKGRT